MSVDLSPQPPGQPAGFRAKRHSGLVDVDRIGALEVLDYWEPIWQKSSLILDPDQFYILASKERCACRREIRASDTSRAAAKARAPSSQCARMKSPTSWKTVRSSAGALLTEVPSQVYGQGIGSNYQRQELKLSKHFKP